MAIELKLSRSDLSEAWGFRLVGGVDFEAPVVIVKVNENSIAENAGLQVGDQVVRVKNASTAGLTHAEVHDLISSADKELDLGVIKGAFEDLIMTVRPIAERQENTLQKQTDAQIINPSTQSQEVARPPQQKKWSTFLQRPKNLKPLCKKQEEERKILGEPYKVKIVKQQKKDPKEKKVVHFQPEVIEIENKTQTHLKEASEVTEIIDIDDENMNLEVETSVKVEEETYADIDEENSEECFEVDEEIQEIMKKYEDEDAYYPDSDEKLFAEAERLKKASELCIKIPKPILKVKPMSIGNLPDNTMSLEEQLAAVQKQLLALSQLPSAIQSTLEAVTKQLNEIVSLKNSSESSNEEIVGRDEAEYRSDDSQVEDTDEVFDENNNYSLSENAEADITENDAEDQQLEELPSENIATDEVQEDVNEEIREPTPPPPELTEEEKEAIRKEEELLAKKQKISQWERAWPWSDVEKPIYKINFLKYQPPPRNLAYLQNSEVYRLIHGMEPPIKGVGFRTEKVLSEKDYVGERTST